MEDTSLRAARGGGEEPRYEFLREMREFLDRRRGDAVLLAEANVPEDRLPKYFQNANQFQMLFSFILNQHVFLAMAREEAAPLADGPALGEATLQFKRAPMTSGLRDREEPWRSRGE